MLFEFFFKKKKKIEFFLSQFDLCLFV